MISGFSVATSVLCSLIDSLPFASKFNYALRALLYGLVLASVYIVVALFAKLIFKASDKFMSTLGIAALNTLVFAVPYINNSAAYSFAGSVGSGIGAGIAFVLAATLINNGSKFIEENDEIPEAFKGRPAMFFYVAMISLAFAGFSDKNIFG
jgi:Na+-translocating ferredoxin:NAD+ oxidoreductase RnfA subunit